MASLREDLNDFKKWRYTALKKHDSYVCLPPVGTECVSKIYNETDRTTKSACFMLSNSFGDRSVITGKELSRLYTYSNGDEINLASSKKRMVDGLMDWEHIVARTGVSQWAFHLNSKKYGTSCQNFKFRTMKGLEVANQSGIRHGVGDFIVCDDANGRPDFKTARIVNGKVFVVTYDMRGFPGLVTTDEMNQVSPKPASILTKEQLEKNKENFITSSLDKLNIFSSTVLFAGLYKALNTEKLKGFANYILQSEVKSYVIRHPSETVRGCGVVELIFSSGSKVVIRTAISVNSQIACNIQYVSANKEVSPNYASILSNNTKVCSKYLVSLDRKAGLVLNVNKGLELLGKHVPAFYPFIKKLLACLDNKLLWEIVSGIDELFGEILAREAKVVNSLNGK